LHRTAILALFIFGFGLFAGLRAARRFWSDESPRVRRVVGVLCALSALAVSTWLWIPASPRWLVALGWLGPATLVERAWRWSGQVPPEPPEPTRLFALFANDLFGWHEGRHDAGRPGGVP